MARKKLLNDVSIEELREMRNEGMSNREIAESLGVSVPTIHRYIGNQPKDMTRANIAEGQRHGEVLSTRRTANRTVFNAPNAENFASAQPEPELPAACLMVQNSIVELVSAERAYIVDMKESTVELVGGLKMTYEELTGIIAELSAIHRKLSNGTRVPLEAW